MNERKEERKMIVGVKRIGINENIDKSSPKQKESEWIKRISVGSYVDIDSNQGVNKEL